MVIRLGKHAGMGELGKPQRWSLHFMLEITGTEQKFKNLQEGGQSESVHLWVGKCSSRILLMQMKIAVKS